MPHLKGNGNAGIDRFVSFTRPLKKRTLLVLLLCLCKSFKEQLLSANAKFIAKASAKI